METDFNVSYENCHSELLSFEFLYKSQIGSLLALGRIRNRFENYISLVFPFCGENSAHGNGVFVENNGFLKATYFKGDLE